jgi:hypothetical protein
VFYWSQFAIRLQKLSWFAPQTTAAFWARDITFSESLAFGESLGPAILLKLSDLLRLSRNLSGALYTYSGDRIAIALYVGVWTASIQWD